MKFIRLPLLVFMCILFTTSLKSQNVSGRDFWFTFPENFAYTTLGAQERLDVSAQLNQLVIVSGCPTAGKIEFPQPAPSVIAFTVVPGVPTIINLPIRNNLYRHTNPPNLWEDSSETVQPNGFHITSDSTIIVYAINYKQFSVDGEAILPTPSLGTSYVVMSKSGWRIPQFTITATQNNTNVTITPNGTTSVHHANSITGGSNVGHSGGVPWSITMNAGETYMVSCFASTGSIVSSDKPVVVLGHTQCTDMGPCQACDVLMSQMLPTNLWGTKYITAQSVQRNLTAGENLADYIDIIAGPLGATVTINNWAGNNSHTLAPYGFMSYENPKSTSASDPGEANTVITSDNPVQITQYAKSGACDNSGIDPEAIFIYPESMWIDEYVFSCSTTITSDTSGIALIVNDIGSPSPITQFELDGTPLSPTIVWNSIGTSTYKYARIGLLVGAHKIQNLANAPFGFYQFAMGSYESYIIQGGAAFSHCSASQLPIALLSFTGKNTGGDNLLQWKTAQEMNSSFFYIERSVNGKDFIPIGNLIGAGNSSSAKSYEFVDHLQGQSNLSPIFYYRLKQTDFDGKSTYSKIVSVQLGVYKTGIVGNIINPLKAGNTLNISYYLEMQDKVNVYIYNTTGQLLSTKTTFCNVGNNEIDIDTGNLNAGVYLLKVTSGSNTDVEKLVVE